MAHPGGERTESPTARQRQRARNHGRFPYSQELTSAMTLAACAATALYFLQSPSGFRGFVAGLLQDATTNDPSELVRRAATYCLSIAAPMLSAAIVSALAGNLLQGLPIFASETSLFKWERLNPGRGLSRLKTQLSWSQWLKLFLLAGLISFVVWKMLSESWDQLAKLPAYSVEHSHLVMRSLMLRVLAYLIGAVGILAIADFYLQRWRFERSIKQTKSEVKDDRKATEGDPAVRNKIRRIQRDTARSLKSR